jgi:hypothetical protein
MDLCLRCDQLFGRCIPLAGREPCTAAQTPEAEEQPPESLAPPKTAAAVIIRRRTGEAHITPILVTDFYRGTEC